MTSTTAYRNPLLAATFRRLVPLETVLITDELRGRPSRNPDYEGDARAEEALAQALSDSPKRILGAVTDIVLERLKAGTAGMSVLSEDRTTIRWPAIAGRWKSRVGMESPRDLGTCGDSLDRNSALAFCHPERRYTYLFPLAPALAELLVVPFYVNGRAAGTLWAARHDDPDREPFDPEDLRRLLALSRFAAAGYQAARMSERLDEVEAPRDPSAVLEPVPTISASARRRAALNLLEDAVQARQTVELLNRGLRESEANLAIELAASQHLQSASALLVEGANSDALYQKLVDAAIALIRADMCGLQVLPAGQDVLRLLACRGFDAARFDACLTDTGTAWVAATGQGERLIVPDVEAWDSIAGTPVLEELRALDIRAIFSTPLLSRTGRLVGVLSTYWRTPYEPTASDLRSFDVLARQTAVLLERRASEEAVGRLAAIVKSSAEAIIGMDLEGVITSWNSAAETLFGYAASEAVGRPVDMLIAPAQKERELEVLRAVLGGSRTERYETVRRRKDGTLFDLSITMSPVRDAQDRIIGAAKLAHDITQRKKSEGALQEADRRKNEFLAILAHELRGPLAPIRSGLELIQSHGVSPAIVASTEVMMGRQVDHMTRLIEDLIDINRISRGTLELRKRPLDLVDAVRLVAETARPSFASMQHELTVTVPVEPVYVNADPTRLSQVLGNLLHNAQKFTDRGGRIDLTVTREGEQVAIHVRDTGIGIASRDLPSIFDMFSQVDCSLERSGGGLGIGLSLVRSLVEMHEGTVVAHSAGAGQGTEFIVRVPMLAAPAGSPRERPAAVAGPAHPLRILAVDDNRDSVESLAMLLEFSGHEVRIARDGIEAVEQAAAFRPDVVLLDLGLPRLDGYGAARRIRCQPGGQDMALVALSGWGQEEDRRRTLEAGFDAHLVKPVDHATLERVLAGFAARKVSADPARARP